MKNLKNKFAVIAILFVLISTNGFSQYHDAASNFQRMVEFAEQKQWYLNEMADRAEQIQTLRDQLESLEKTKKAVENSYRLAEKIQEDLRVLGSVADGGVAGLVHAFETRLGRSVNPTNYIPNIPQFQGLRETMSYDAKTKISSDTRRSHKELFTHNPRNPDNKGGLSLTRNIRALDATILAGAYEFSNLWRVYEDESQADNIDRNKYLAEEFREIADRLAKELNEEGKYILTQGERMELMLYIGDLNDKADQYDKNVADAIRLQIEAEKLSDFELESILMHGISINIANNFKHSIKPYNSRQKFSLATFEKTYVQGKIDQDLSSANPKKYMNGKTTTDYMVTPWKNSIYSTPIN